MKGLFKSADQFLQESSWKDLTILKFCLISLGISIGTAVSGKQKKPVQAGAMLVFLGTYIPLMRKYFKTVFSK